MRRLALLTIAACTADPAHHLPDSGIDAPACAPAGPPMQHAGDITADETWASGIHEVTATVTVKGGTLTIAPCTEVRVAADASIEATQAATAIVADGTAADPITFVRDVADKPWGHVSVFGPSALSLAHVTMTGGGTAGDYTSAQQLGATIVARGDATLPQLVSIDTVDVDGSSGIGVFMNSARFATGSTALTITRSGFHPILLGADSATDLPDGAYTGNAVDAILLQSAGTSAAFEQGRTLLADVTLHDRGVPYQVGVTPQVIVVADGIDGHGHVTLSIDAGVALLFAPQGTTGSSRIQVRGTSTGVAQGALVVSGTAAKPVVFSSAAVTPAPGDWQGLEFRGAVDPTTSIDHAQIQFAGGNSFSVGVCESDPSSHSKKEDSAVLISLAPNLAPTAFVTNTLISDSANAGVYRGWRATDVDFTATNTFVNVAACLESNIPDAGNACPVTACPVE